MPCSIPCAGDQKGFFVRRPRTFGFSPKDFADATADENSAVASFESLVASKKKEIDALTAAIESKTMRVGELGVKNAEAENDLEDTKVNNVYTL